MLDLERPWIELPWVVLDCETTGVDPQRCQVVQVAAARFERGELVDSYAALCKPPGPIPPDATKIHGITDAMVESALPMVAHEPHLADLAAGALPVAYNESFDRTILHRFMVGPSCPAWALQQWVCPLVILRDVERVIEGKGWYRLAAACERWGVELVQAHSAQADAIATGQLLWALYQAGRIKPCSARKLLEHIARRHEAHQAYRQMQQLG